MFMVINKDKIISYIVSVSTVAILFFMSVTITKKNDEILETSTKETKNAIENSIENTINYNSNYTLNTAMTD